MTYHRGLRKKSPRKKSKSLIVHARNRALERYNLSLHVTDLANIVHIIQTGAAEMQDRQSNRVSVWILTYKNVRVRVVYDKLRKAIVTFLPLEPR